VGVSTSFAAVTAGVVAKALSFSLGDLFFELDRLDNGGVSLGIG
jgi:hypothetical protein